MYHGLHSTISLDLMILRSSTCLSETSDLHADFGAWSHEKGSGLGPSIIAEKQIIMPLTGHGRFS